MPFKLTESRRLTSVLRKRINDPTKCELHSTRAPGFVLGAAVATV